MANIDRYFKNTLQVESMPCFKKIHCIKIQILQRKDYGVIGHITKGFFALLKYWFHSSFHKKTSWVSINFKNLGLDFQEHVSDVKYTRTV